MKILMRCLAGSKLYGLSTPESDTDYKAVYLPTTDELLLNTYAPIISISSKGKNTPEDVDSEYIALPRFIELACCGKASAYDMLHAEGDALLETSPEWELILENRKRFYTKDASTFINFAKEQALRYSLKHSRYKLWETLVKICEENAGKRLSEIRDLLPITDESSWIEAFNGRVDAEFYQVQGRCFEITVRVGELQRTAQNELHKFGERIRKKQKAHGVAVDWDSLVHALRAAYTMVGILIDGDYSYPLPQTEYLMRVKLGQVPVEEVKEELERLMDNLTKLQAESTLPEYADRMFWDMMLLDIYFKNIPQHCKAAT